MKVQSMTVFVPADEVIKYLMESGLVQEGWKINGQSLTAECASEQCADDSGQKVNGFRLAFRVANAAVSDDDE